MSLDRYDVSALARSAPQLINTLFEHRLRLREQVADWHARGFMSLPAQRAVRNALRIARYATDMLGELNIGYTQLGPHEKTLRGFRGADLNTLLNPAFATGHDLPFEAGDLLLMRGMHHNSAAIARIGDVDSQFSHLCIVHTDEAGKQWVVESPDRGRRRHQPARQGARARPRPLRASPPQGRRSRAPRRRADPRPRAPLA